MTILAPAIFVGHGSPTNALDDNAFTRAWRALAARFAQPKAIVAISAHWETKGTLITSAARQRTIHDFYNFPPEMYRIAYPAPGDPDLAKRIEAMLTPYARADLDGWGLDHGVWSVLCHMYPEADVPVVVVSMDTRKSPAEHYAVGQTLAALRREGVMIFGSGNIVHNLRYFRRGDMTPLDFAVRFDAWVTDRIRSRDHQALIEYRGLTPDAPLALPEDEHYLPLLYVLAGQAEDETPEILTDTVMSAVSMTSVAVGLPT
jgi:4,5-DOPA dioxygenase extradiol